MANKTGLKPENKIDERLAEKFGVADQEQQVGKDYIDGGMDKFDAYRDDPKNIEEAQALIAANNAQAAANPMNWKDKEAGGGRKRSLPAWLKGKKAASFSAVALILALFGITLPFQPGPLVSFMFVENLTIDLGDKIPAFGERGKRHNLNRLFSKTVADDVVKGCSTLSIRCKGKMIGPKQQARLAKSGIEIEGRTVASNWTVAEKITFRGQSYTPSEWRIATRDNPQVRAAQLRANNPKFLSFEGSFVKRVLVRYGLFKQPKIGTSGSTADRLNQLLTAAGTDDAKNLTIRQAVDAEGEPINNLNELVDENGNVVTDRNGNPVTYTDNEADKARRVLGADASPRAPPGPGIKAMAGALGVLGIYDVTCSINNMIGAATIAQRIAANNDIVAYGWEIFSLTHKLKSGNGTPEDAELLGVLMTEEDTREKIIDLVATAESDGDTEVLVDNPNYRETFMSSNLVNMSINGGVAPASYSQNKASLAFDMRTLLRGFGGISAGLDTAVNLGNANVCNFVQNPIVRGGSLLAAGVAALFSVGTFTAGQVALTAGIVAGMFFLQQLINASVTGSVLDYIADGEDTVARGDFAWTGGASLQSTAAQTVGMIPANGEEMVGYRQLRNQTFNEIAQAESIDANPLDISNQHSFLGTIARNYYKQVGFSASPASVIGGIPSMLSNSLSPTTGASADDVNRYKQCKDKDLLELGIEADVQCNVRYYLPEDLLAKDPEEVALWMENEGCGGSGCVEKDTQTGLPPGYIPPDARESQNALLAAVRGATIGQFKSEVDLVNDYGKFLEYCALRAAPYGKTFQEANLVGGASSGWLTGEKCRERSEMLDNFRVYTMDVAYIEDEEYEEAARTASAGAGTKFRAASYNVLGASHTPGAWRDRIVKVVDNIKGEKRGEDPIDVIGFQELEPEQRTYVDSNLPGYQRSTHGKQSDSIMWNTSKFELVDKGSWKTTYFSRDQIDEPWVLLRDKNTGQTVYIMNVHDPINRGQGSPTTRYNNTLAHIETIKKLSPTAPIVFTGDFNQGYEKDQGAGALSNEKTAYCMLTQGGYMNHGYDVYTGRPEKCPNPIPRSTNLGNIDHIYVSPQIEVPNYYALQRKTVSGSDHPVIVADIVIPGSGSGGDLSGDIAWPLGRTNYDKYKSDFLGSHYVGGGFLGGGSSSVDVAWPGISGEPTYSMFSGTVLQQPLGRASYRCTGTPNVPNNGGLLITSEYQGGVVNVAYAHGANVTLRKGDSVNAGDQIMTVGNVGNSCGAHLHMDISYNGQSLCPQDLFRAMERGGPIDMKQLVKDATPTCG